MVKLSTKGEYGLLALVELALQDPGEPLQASMIAKRQNIPKQYLDQLMMILKRSGLVTSVRGRQGGYRLSRRAADITLLDAVCALEGPLENYNFIRKNTIRQRSMAWGILKSVWDKEILNAKEALKQRTLEEIANASRASDQEGMYYI